MQKLAVKRDYNLFSIIIEQFNLCSYERSYPKSDEGKIARIYETEQGKKNRVHALPMSNIDQLTTFNFPNKKGYELQILLKTFGAEIKLS